MRNVRQGDVQFIRVVAIPPGARPKDGRVLFRGEATGHAHVVDIGQLFEAVDGSLYLRTDRLANVTHEEHRTLTLPPGTYLVSRKRLADLGSRWREVRD